MFIACIFTNSCEKGNKLVKDNKSSDGTVKFRLFMPRKKKSDILAKLRQMANIFKVCQKTDNGEARTRSFKHKAARIAVVQS